MTALALVPDTGTTTPPLIPTGGLISVPGGFAIEVVPDGAYTQAQARELIARLRADSSAMSRLWSAILNPGDHATRDRAVLALSALLHDAQRLELTPDVADDIADQLGSAAHEARTVDPAEVALWGAADRAVSERADGGC